MFNTRLMQSVIIIILLLPAYAFSDNETKNYTVSKGDTLWQISAKELNDSFLWPKVWKENPEINNPDKLYPGQNIRIPIYLIQKSSDEIAQPAPAVIIKKIPSERPKPVPVLEPFVDRNLLIASGYISPSVPAVGVIDSSPSGRNLLGSADIVYLKTSAPAPVGQKFYIIRAEQEVRHPVTNKKEGFVIRILGVAEVSKIEFGYTHAKIIQAFAEINSGDLLDDYYEISAPLVSPPFRRPDFNGVIVASESVKFMSAQLDVVFLDKGKKDGIRVGDMFKIVGQNDGHFISGGVLQVISETDNTSAGLVQRASEPITVGNLFTQLE